MLSFASKSLQNPITKTSTLIQLMARTLYCSAKIKDEYNGFGDGYCLLQGGRSADRKDHVTGIFLFAGEAEGNNSIKRSNINEAECVLRDGAPIFSGIERSDGFKTMVPSSPSFWNGGSSSC